MLRTYGPDCDGNLIEADGGKQIPVGATWIDLEEPTREEEKLVERCIGIEVPTREDLVEIEPSSRLYQKNGALYMTMSVLFGVEDGAPSTEPLGFVLAGEHLVTVRYVTPKPIRAFAQHVSLEPELTRDALTVLLRLLDAVVDRLADELEDAGSEIERISDQIFRRADPSQGRMSPAVLEALLNRIGRTQSLLTKVRETAVSTNRLITFLKSVPRLLDPQAAHSREYLVNLAQDATALIDHSAFLGSNLAFLLDASLGLISVQQNAIIKIFSVAAVIFLPPTLVGTVYGMNFEHMPELDWLYGYPFALALMLLSAVLPYWFFKRRGWL